jgi:uncharacterized integral membrane protein
VHGAGDSSVEMLLLLLLLLFIVVNMKHVGEFSSC